MSADSFVTNDEVYSDESYKRREAEIFESVKKSIMWDKILESEEKQRRERIAKFMESDYGKLVDSIPELERKFYHLTVYFFDKHGHSQTQYDLYIISTGAKKIGKEVLHTIDPLEELGLEFENEEFKHSGLTVTGVVYELKSISDDVAVVLQERMGRFFYNHFFD